MSGAHWWIFLNLEKRIRDTQASGDIENAIESQYLEDGSWLPLNTDDFKRSPRGSNLLE